MATGGSPSLVHSTLRDGVLDGCGSGGEREVGGSGGWKEKVLGGMMRLFERMRRVP